MSIEISALGRARLCREAVFNVDESGTPANFIDLPTVEKSIALTPLFEHQEPETIQQFVHAFTDSLMVLTKKSATLNFTTLLAGTGAPNDGNDVWPTDANWGLRRLLSTLYGGVFQGTPQAAATIIVVGSTASVLNVTAGHGNTMGTAGGAIAVTMPSGLIEAREILSVTANSVTLKVALSGVPATGAACYWATTFYTIEGVGSILPSLQMLIEGVEPGDEYSVKGMQGTFGIDISPNTLARLTVQLLAASYLRTSTLSLAAASIANFSPVSTISGELIVGSGTITATQTRNRISHGASSWQPGMMVVPINSPEGLDNSGMIGWKRGRSRAWTGSFTAYEDPGFATWQAADVARTPLSIFQQIGMSLSGIILLSAPTVQISAVPVRTDMADLYGQIVTWGGRNDAAIASPTTDLMRAANRAHVW